MQKNENDFEYTYVAPTQAERKHIEHIRESYLPKQENAFTRLQQLDKKVQTPPMVTALTLGIIGTLIFGLGLALILEWNNLPLGTALSALGLVPILLAYPLYRAVLKRQKEKYAEEILQLSENLLKNS